MRSIRKGRSWWKDIPAKVYLQLTQTQRRRLMKVRRHTLDILKQNNRVNIVNNCLTRLTAMARSWDKTSKTCIDMLKRRDGVSQRFRRCSNSFLLHPFVASLVYMDLLGLTGKCDLTRSKVFISFHENYSHSVTRIRLDELRSDAWTTHILI